MILNFPRMQNVLLAISAFLMLSLLWSRLCYTVDMDGVEYSIKFTEHVQFLIFTLITFALCIAAICYWKQYILQIRVCIINILILLGYQIWLIVAFFQLKSVYTFTVSTLFPLVSIILIILAIRFSWKDASVVIARDFRRKAEKKLKK